MKYYIYYESKLLKNEDRVVNARTHILKTKLPNHEIKVLSNMKFEFNCIEITEEELVLLTLKYNLESYNLESYNLESYNWESKYQKIFIVNEHYRDGLISILKGLRPCL